MTEKEAWLKLASKYEPGGRPPVYRDQAKGLIKVSSGICFGLEYLWLQGDITRDMDNTMDDRLHEFFAPPHTFVAFFWPKGECRAERATACCFLAAMCKDEE